MFPELERYIRDQLVLSRLGPWKGPSRCLERLSQLKCNAGQERGIRTAPQLPHPRVGLIRGARLHLSALGLPFLLPRDSWRCSPDVPSACSFALLPTAPWADAYPALLLNRAHAGPGGDLHPHGHCLLSTSCMPTAGTTGQMLLGGEKIRWYS